MSESGLDLPLVASLTEKLKEKGVVVESDFTVDGFVDGVCRALGGGAK